MRIDYLENLKKRSVVITIVIFIIIMVLRIDGDFAKYKHLKYEQKTMISKQVNYIFNSKIDAIKRALINRLEYVASQRNIKNAIEIKNKQYLYNVSIQKFETMKKDYPTLSIMNYYLPNNTNLLSVYKTKSFKDNTKETKKIISNVINSKLMHAGFRSDNKNNITYSIAVPILENGEILGVIELGIDIQGIMKQINKFINASYDYNISIGFIKYKNKTYHIIEGDTKISSLIELSDISKLEQYIKSEKRKYFLIQNKTKLKDLHNDNLGTVVYAFDITDIESNFKNDTLLSILQQILMMLLACFSFIWLFNYIIKQSKQHDLKVESIVDNQNAIVLVTDSKRIIQANKSFLNFFDISNLNNFLENYNCICDKFEKYTGYLEKQMGNKNWLEYMISNDTKVHKVKMVDKNNELHTFQVHYREFLQDKHIEFVVSFDDITEIEKLNKNLEKRVYEKTKELFDINENLEQKVKQEVEKNREKEQHMLQQSRLAQMGEMISMIAHQWRQPLAAISSTSGAINIQARLNKLDINTTIEYTNKISEYSQHLSSTIDDFREFFKSNKEKESVTYNELVNSVLGIIEISLFNKNIELIRQLDSTKELYTYPNEIKQVILNLIKNAEDILIEKDIENPTIIVKTTESILTVSDNAGGVPNNIINKIFDPYFSTKKEKDGTGLGLYMSKTIIEEHCGGKLTVSNDENGAVFKIVLK